MCFPLLPCIFHYSIIILNSQDVFIYHIQRSLMSDQTVLIDQFLSSVIGTIHPDEIFDSIIDTAVRLLSPDGLLLTIRDDVSPSYHVTRSFGDISWEKDSFLDSSILLEQLLNADSYIPFMPGAGLPTALDGVSSHTRSWLIRQNRCLLSEVQPGTDRLSLHRAAQSHATVCRSGVRTVQDRLLCHPRTAQRESLHERLPGLHHG